MVEAGLLKLEQDFPFMEIRTKKNLFPIFSFDQILNSAMYPVFISHWIEIICFFYLICNKS